MGSQKGCQKMSNFDVFYWSPKKGGLILKGNFDMSPGPTLCPFFVGYPFQNESGPSEQLKIGF